MNEEKEESRKSNKWVIIIIILLLAFLGFYLYNQYSSLFLGPPQETLDENTATEGVPDSETDKTVTTEGSNTTNNEQEEQQEQPADGDTNKEQQTASETEGDQYKQQSTVEDTDEDKQNGKNSTTETEDEDTEQTVIKEQDSKESQTVQTEDRTNEEPIRKENGQFGREIVLLIIGQDKKENVEEGKVQSDSIILANLKPEKKVLTLTAVPSHKEYSGNKLQTYDRSQLMTIMESLTGANPDYYFVIDYEGFKNIVNLISGVEVTINKSFEVPELGLYLKKGSNLLSGQEALNYARYYDSEENELTRIKRQQQVMEGFADKIFQRNTLLDIPRLYKTVVQTIKNVNTNFDYDLAIEAYNFISNSSDFDIKYDVLEINDNMK